METVLAYTSNVILFVLLVVLAIQLLLVEYNIMKSMTQRRIHYTLNL